MNVRPSQLLNTHRETIRTIARAHGAERVWVFGSVARGDDRDGSDLDLLVELERGRTLFDLGAIWSELTALLGCPVDITTTGSLTEDEQAALVTVAL